MTLRDDDLAQRVLDTTRFHVRPDVPANDVPANDVPANDVRHRRFHRSATALSTRYVAELHGVGKDTVKRIWDQHRIRPSLIVTSPAARPLEDCRVHDVVGLHVHPPVVGMVFAFDDDGEPDPGDAVITTEAGLRLYRPGPVPLRAFAERLSAEPLAATTGTRPAETMSALGPWVAAGFRLRGVWCHLPDEARLELDTQESDAVDNEYCVSTTTWLNRVDRLVRMLRARVMTQDEFSWSAVAFEAQIEAADGIIRRWTRPPNSADVPGLRLPAFPVNAPRPRRNAAPPS